VLGMAALIALTSLPWAQPAWRSAGVVLLYAALLAQNAALLRRDARPGAQALRLLAGLHLLALVVLLARVLGIALSGQGLAPFTMPGAMFDVFLIAGVLPVLASVLFLLGLVERTTEELRASARVDFLTGVYNRRAVEELGERLIRGLRRDGDGLAAVVIDLDHFKALNDRHGHAAGDEALVKFAQRIAATLRAGDVFGRVGGEEFVVLLPKADATIARLTAERLRLRITQPPFALACGEAAITASMGVAVLEPEDSDLRSLFARADAALYVAKAQGRNRVVSAVPGPAAETLPATEARRA
jgi:diguanylate cyclase (GGDEF)-like protein